MKRIGLEGTRPNRLGVDSNGRLSQCPRTPNCVCSQSEDRRHAIDPIAFDDTPADAMRRLQDVVRALRGATIVTASRRYLYAEVRSRVLGFVDDLEFYCDRRAKVIHVRSAARLGYSDLGVNRRRVETVRKAFARAGR